MIFEPQKYYFIFQDAVHSLGVGFLTGFLNRLISPLTGKNKRLIFIKDLLISIFFAVMIYSYSISFTNYNVMRWYNVVVALAGMVLFTPCVYSAVSVRTGVVKITAVYMCRAAAGCIRNYAEKAKQKRAEKRQKFTQKNKEELLKEEDILLYN